MKHVTRIMADGVQVLEPAIQFGAFIDEAIADRLSSLTDEQQANTNRYVVTNENGELVDTYVVTRDLHTDTYRIRLAWTVSDRFDKAERRAR